MMKNFKSFIIYGSIAVLMIAAFAGYIFVEKPSNNFGVNTVNNQGIKNKSGGTSAIPDQTLEKDEKSALITSTYPIVGIGRGEEYAGVTRTAIENAGGLKNIIKKGDTVLIKPNICTFAGPNSPLITDYRVAQEIVKMAKEYGASRIFIAEGPISGTVFNDPAAVKFNGYGSIKGVEFVDINNLNKEDCYEIKPDKSLTGKALYLPKIYMDVDIVIGAAKLKTHFQPDAIVSLSLKNIFGITSGNIYGFGFRDNLHSLGLKEAIVDLNKIRKPDFVVIDGIVGGEGYGPVSNTPVKSNIIFAGIDPVAVDTVALTFMGFTAAEIPHVKLAAEEKIGIADLNKINIVGADLQKIKMNFKPAQ